MNFYTLTYDANLPTKQQINVPTNTDYKVGIKVRRNGEIQNLSPNSVMLGTLSADNTKTNGYVTFTLSAGDNANYTTENLIIQKGYDFDDTLSNSGGPAKSGEKANFLSADSSAEQLGIAGLEITVDDIKWGKTEKATQVTPEDITEWYDAKTYIGSGWVFFKWPNGNWALGYQANNKNALAWFSEDGTQSAWVEKATIDPRWILVTGAQGTGYRTTAGKYWAVAYKLKMGTPWSAKFDLVENIYKSQLGDTADIDFSNTVNITGTMSDQTEFNFNAVVK